MRCDGRIAVVIGAHTCQDRQYDQTTAPASRDRRERAAGPADERGEGHGLVWRSRMNSVLYGGDLTLGDAPDSGLAATLTLPFVPSVFAAVPGQRNRHL